MLSLSGFPFNVNAPLKVFIVDDEAPARARLRRLLEDCCDVLPNTVVGEASLAQEMLDTSMLSAADVVLLDIEMPGMDGLCCARELMRRKDPPAVIFITSHADYAVAAFDVAAFDYLLKPVRLQRLVESFKRVQRRRSDNSYALATPTQPIRYLTVNDKGRVLKVPVDDVLYLRAELKYVTLRTRERELVLTDSLGHLEQMFALDFVRIHRNCLVSRPNLVGFETGLEDGESRWFAVLSDWPARLLVSRRQTQLVKAFRDQIDYRPTSSTSILNSSISSKLRYTLAKRM